MKKLLLSNYGLSVIAGFGFAMMATLSCSALFDLSLVRISRTGFRLMGFMLPIILFLFGLSMFKMIQESRQEKKIVGAFIIPIIFLSVGVLTTFVMWR